MNWYYVESGQQRGPVTEADLEGLFTTGKIQSDTLIWREGMPNWLAYREVKGGSSAASFTPPLASSDAGSLGGVVCSQCGQLFPVDQVIKYGDAHVCASCKPVFVQKLREGTAAIPGTMDYASFGTRLAAKIVDGIILSVVNMALNLVAGVANASAGGASLLPMLIVMGVNYLINFSYAIFFVGKFGATPGKMICKIKVVTAEGAPVGFGKATGRCFAEILSGLTCCIGYIMAGFDEEKRALHDRICNTRVVKK